MKTGALLLGKFALLLATMAFLVTASLFVVGAYLTTWPVLRQSPRTERKRALMGMATSLFALVQAYAPDADDGGSPDRPAMSTDPVDNPEDRA